jgi:hypothetical protein
MTVRRRLTAILAADVVGYELKPLSICWNELWRNWAREAATGRRTIPTSNHCETIRALNSCLIDSIKVEAMKS